MCQGCGVTMATVRPTTIIAAATRAALAAARGGPPTRVQGANRIGGFADWPGLIAGLGDWPTLTEEQAMGLPGIGRGVNLICSVVSQLRPHPVRGADRVATPTQELDPNSLLTDPDPTWHGRVEWTSAAVRDLILHGNAFADRRDLDWAGFPRSLPLLAAGRVHWETRPEGDQYVYTAENGTRTAFAPPDMWHAIVGARSGCRLGTGILAAYQLELKIMRAVEDATWVVMRDGRPAGILSVDSDLITEDELASARNRFMAALKEGSVPALVKADFKPVAWDANSLALVPAREFNMRLASDIVGVPPYLLGVPSESRVYSNMESEWSNFLKVTVNRYTSALEGPLSRCYPRGTTVVYDVEELRRPEMATRWGAYATAYGIGAMTVAEIRERERLAPLPDPEPAQQEGPADADDDENN